MLEMPRLKGPDDWVSDYQAFVVVGGLKMWMTLDTAVATTWVISKICFMQNCIEDRLFVGAFIPSIPPSFVVLDLFERGLLQLGAIFGLLGHTYVNLAGSHVIGCPIAMGILDLGQIVGPDGFNHTGSIGLGFWEDNLPNWIMFMDPALSLITFLKCGNIFYPIPGVPVPVPKSFQLWGLPWFFPGGLIFKFSFFFGDLGGCFFLKGSVNYMSNSPTKWVFAIPIAIKLLAPSWLFILSDVRVRGQSIHPCMLGICKATIHTGQFSIAGPLEPMLLLLEEVAVAKTCEGVETLPDITWVIMGSHYTMNRAQYVVESEAYGEKECLTAFTPEFQMIPGFDIYTFGDVWIHAFYTIFEVVPLKRVGFAVSDQRYYEKNGCVSGNGQGPATDAKSMEQGVSDWQDGQKDDELQRRLDAYEKDIGWKRYQNWMADLAGMADNSENDKLCTELGAPYCKCSSGFRFKEGSCIKAHHSSELERLKLSQVGPAQDGSTGRLDDFDAVDQETVPPSFGDAAFGVFSARQRFDGDGTSAATRFWAGSGGSGFSDSSSPQGLLQGSTIFIEEENVEAHVSPSTTRLLPAGSPPDLEFEQRKRLARKERGAAEKLALKDRIVRHVEPGITEQMRFAELGASRANTATHDSRTHSSAGTTSGAAAGVQLTTELVTSRTQLHELYRNASMVLSSWAPHLNVSEEQLKGWWRGESEEFIRYQRAKAQHDYDTNIQKARLLAHSFKVKSILNKRLLRKVAAQMTATEDAAETAYKYAVENVEGPIHAEVVNPQPALDTPVVSAEKSNSGDSDDSRTIPRTRANVRALAEDHPAGTVRGDPKQLEPDTTNHDERRNVKNAKHSPVPRLTNPATQADHSSSSTSSDVDRHDPAHDIVIRRDPLSGEWQAVVARGSDEPPVVSVQDSELQMRTELREGDDGEEATTPLLRSSPRKRRKHQNGNDQDSSDGRHLADKVEDVYANLEQLHRAFSQF